MPRLLGVDIPNDRQTVISLQYLYGVGQHIARELCHKAGIDPHGRARDLHEDELARLAQRNSSCLVLPNAAHAMVHVENDA